MPVTATTSVEAQRPVGDVWPIEVTVTDVNGYTTSETPVVTVTKPDGTTAVVTVDNPAGSRYRAGYPLAVPGRHTATVTTSTYGAIAFAVTAVAETPAGAMPGVADFNAYAGANSHTDDAIADALATEAAAQRAVCAVPAFYPDDLRGALMRRVARNLGMRLIPLAQPVGDAEAGGPAFSPYDPEINRLERPHRRLLVA